MALLLFPWVFYPFHVQCSQVFFVGHLILWISISQLIHMYKCQQALQLGVSDVYVAGNLLI